MKLSRLTTYNRQDISFVHANETIRFTRRAQEDIQLHDLCAKITPPCYLNPALMNGHLQTAWTAIQTAAASIYYKRCIFSAQEPAFEGHFAVDCVVRPPEFSGGLVNSPLEDSPEDCDGNESLKDPAGVGHIFLPPRTSYFQAKEFSQLMSNDRKPLLLVLAGLSGGSDSSYVRDALVPLTVCTGDPTGLSGGAWEVLVVNSRGCAGSRLTSSVMYNARSTWDVRQVIQWARSQWPNRPFFALGFSIGANILCNYLAEEGPHCDLKAAVVVSNPWNLEICHRALLRSFIGSEIYSKAMGASMRSLFEMNLKQLTCNTGIDPEGVKRGRYLYEFDRDVQCPLWGYPTHTAYYRDASTSDSVLAIRIPLFAIHADDDPIATPEALPLEEFRINPYTVLCITSGGGHIGWYGPGGDRWYAKATFEFLCKTWAHMEGTIPPAQEILSRVKSNGVFRLDATHNGNYIHPVK